MRVHKIEPGTAQSEQVSKLLRKKNNGGRSRKPFALVYSALKSLILRLIHEKHVLIFIIDLNEIAYQLTNVAPNARELRGIHPMRQFRFA